MKIREYPKLTGALVIEIHGADGELKSQTKINNLVVSSGKAFVASRMVGNTKAVMSHMGVGTGNVAAAAGDTTLGAELTRAALTSATANSNVVTYAAVFGPTVGTGAITEAGLFNAAAAGDMLARTVFPVVNKGADDTMSITWTVTNT